MGSIVTSPLAWATRFSCGRTRCAGKRASILSVDPRDGDRERQPSGARAQDAAMANDGFRRDRIRILMRSPVIRFVSAALLLALYVPDVLARRAAPAPPASADADLLRDIDDSQIAFSAGRYAEALEPTRRLTIRMPTQAMYFNRLARIHRELGDAPRGGAGAGGVYRTSPTPEDACPTIAQAYDRVPDPAAALDAYERCAALIPGDPDSHFSGTRLQRRRTCQGGKRGPRAGARPRSRLPGRSSPPRHPELRGRRPGEARAVSNGFLLWRRTRQEEVAVWLERTRHERQPRHILRGAGLLAHHRPLRRTRVPDVRPRAVSGSEALHPAGDGRGLASRRSRCWAWAAVWGACARRGPIGGRVAWAASLARDPRCSRLRRPLATLRRHPRLCSRSAWAWPMIVCSRLPSSGRIGGTRTRATTARSRI